MLDFLHPYVQAIINMIDTSDEFLSRNGSEFNSYVLSIILLVIGFAKFKQKAKKTQGLKQKLHGKLEIFAGLNFLMPSQTNTEIACLIVFFCFGMQIFVMLKEAKAELLMSLFARQIFREVFYKKLEKNEVQLVFLPPKIVQEYGPLNVMYFAMFVGMTFGAYCLYKAPATAEQSLMAERMKLNLKEKEEKKKN
jgi:hypothetical protein